MPLGSDLEKQKEIHPFRCLGYHGKTGANKKRSATESASCCFSMQRATTRTCHSDQHAPCTRGARSFQWWAPARPSTNPSRLQPPVLAPQGRGTRGTPLQQHCLQPPHNHGRTNLQPNHPRWPHLKQLLSGGAQLRVKRRSGSPRPRLREGCHPLTTSVLKPAAVTLPSRGARPVGPRADSY